MARAAIDTLPPALPASEPTLRLVYSGGEPPAVPRRRPVVENGVLAMAVFLGTEAMLFAGLISAFLILRAGTALWPPADQPRLPVAVTGVNSIVLLLSGYTMQRAARASRARCQAETLRWLGATAGLGVSFLLVQGAEWVQLIRHGLRASSSQYGATFYTLIGCHAVHMLAAVVTLVVVLAVIRRGHGRERGQARIEVCRLYWLFVVGVWPVLYVLVYLT
jgi:heme/copper-type cytochrome/quinol oxidase subunit 3